jgi:hypothetical protein
MIAGRIDLQPDVINDPCTLYGARRFVIEYLNAMTWIMP